MLRNPLRLLAVTAVGLVSWTSTASADLLVNPSGGSTISFSDTDDGMTTRALGGTFKYFGGAITTIGVSVNGSLSTTSTKNYGSDAALGSLTNLIAPFYDDFTLYTSGTVSDQVVAGSYYAATWNGVFDHNYIVSGSTDNFQAILFTGNTTLNNYQFLAGDIAFSYGSMLAPMNTGTATVGLSSGSASTYVPLPGTTDGQIRNMSLLPTGSSFLLLRPNSSNSYDASIQSTVQPAAVPEPSSWVLLGAGLLLVARPRSLQAARSLAAVKVPCR